MYLSATEVLGLASFCLICLVDCIQAFWRWLYICVYLRLFVKWLTNVTRSGIVKMISERVFSTRDVDSALKFVKMANHFWLGLWHFISFWILDWQCAHSLMFCKEPFALIKFIFLVFRFIFVYFNWNHWLHTLISFLQTFWILSSFFNEIDASLVQSRPKIVLSWPIFT